MKKRILSMILASSMVLGMLPVTALGYESEGEGNLPATEEVAIVSSDTGGTPDTGGEFEVATMSTGSYTTEFGGGTGTIDDPYLISESGHLQALATAVNNTTDGYSFSGEYFLVTTDNLDSITPIGTGNRFEGNFDGNNCTINLDYGKNAYTYMGLFGIVGSSGIIKNVNVTSAYDVGVVYEYLYEVKSGDTVSNLNPTAYIGAVAGLNHGILINCNNTGALVQGIQWTTGYWSEVDSYYYYNETTGTLSNATDYADTGTGGVNASSDIKQYTKTSYTFKDTDATLYAGGIAGYNTGKVVNCSNEGDVYAYAVVETATEGTQAFNQDSVSVTTTSGSANNETNALSYAGGLVGNNTSSGEVINSYNTGRVFADSKNLDLSEGVKWKSGVRASTPTINYNYAATHKSYFASSSYTSGENYSGEYAVSTGNSMGGYGGIVYTYAKSYAGGLIGQNLNDSTAASNRGMNYGIANCYNLGVVTATAQGGEYYTFANFRSADNSGTTPVVAQYYTPTFSRNFGDSDDLYAYRGGLVGVDSASQLASTATGYSYSGQTYKNAYWLPDYTSFDEMGRVDSHLGTTDFFYGNDRISTEKYTAMGPTGQETEIYSYLNGLIVDKTGKTDQGIVVPYALRHWVDTYDIEYLADDYLDHGDTEIVHELYNPYILKYWEDVDTVTDIATSTAHPYPVEITVGDFLSRLSIFQEVEGVDDSIVRNGADDQYAKITTSRVASNEEEIVMTIVPNTMANGEDEYRVKEVWLYADDDTKNLQDNYPVELTAVRENVYSVAMESGALDRDNAVVAVIFEELSDFGDCGTYDETWIPVKSVTDFDNMVDGNKYYLQGDLKITDPIVFAKNDLVLCLNGFEISSSGNSNVLEIVGGDLTLGGGAREVTDANGVKTEVIGTISHYGTGSGTGVSITNGTFTMRSGIISGNNSTINSDNGGGVNINSGTFNMLGGLITGNSVGGHGGGVRVADGATFNMSGGEISGNTAGTTGYGDQVYVKGTMNVSGNPVISATDSDDDGVYLPSGAIINITGELKDSYTDSGVIVPTASIAVSAHSSNEKKIAMTGDELLDISGMGKYFVGAAGEVAFYRYADQCIYLAKIDAEPIDFELTLDDGYSETTNRVLEAMSNGLYQETSMYTGYAQKISAELNCDNRNTVTVRYYDLETGNLVSSMVNVGTYKIYAEVTQQTESEYFNISDGIYLGTFEIYQYDLKTGHFTATVDPTSYDFTGSSITPPPTVKLTKDVLNNVDNEYEFVLGKDYTVTYVNFAYKASACIDVGTYYARVVSTSTCNYEFDEYIQYKIGIGETSLNILNFNGLDHSTKTYGESITLEIQPTSKDNILSTADLKNYEFYIYGRNDNGEFEIGNIVGGGVDDEEVSSMTFDDSTGILYYHYDTAAKDLVIGTNEIWVVFQPNSGFVPSANMQYAISDTMTINLARKPLTAAVPQNTSRVYDGSKYFNLFLKLVWVDEEDDRNEKVDKTSLVEKNDEVFALANGSVEDPNVGTNKKLYINTVELQGADADYYTLAIADVNTDYLVEIKELNLNSVDKYFDVDVMLGVGTYATPEITHTVYEGTDLAYEAAIAGSLVYTTAGYESYEAIVAHLKTLPVNSVFTVNYTFTPSNSSNYLGADIKGTITFHVVNIQFSQVDDGLKIASYPIYGNEDNIFYDPSFFVANVGTSTTTGDYTLVVKDSLGNIQEQGMENYAHLPVDEYTYEVYFTSFDNAYVEILVKAGVFYVNHRVLEYTWDSLTFVYDSTAKLPIATITNKVGTDDVSIVATGSNTIVGDYSATLVLTGADRGNYKLLIDSIGYYITPAVTRGVVTVLYSDTDASETLTIGDVVTADLIAVSPSGGTAMYHWYRNDVLISGATSASYTLGASDVVGTVLRCDVSFSGNTTGTLSSHGMVVGNKFFKGSVVISHEEGVLTATVSGENTTNYSIIWSGLSQSSAGTTYTMGYEDFNNPVVVTVLANELSGYTGSVSGTITVSSKKPFVPEISATPGDTFVTVNWDVGFDGGAPIQNYILTVKNEAKNDFTGSPFTISGDAESFVVSGLTNGHTYTFQLDVVNSVGTSTSNIVSATPGAVNSSVDVNGDITTTTTVTEYEDNDGNLVTETVVVVYDAATGITVTTTTIEIAYRDGGKSTDVTVETKNSDNEILELTEDYIYTDADEEYVLEFETFWDEDESSGSLVVKDAREDTIEVPVSVMNRVLLRDDTTATFITPYGQVTFDNEALRSIFYQAEPLARDSFVMEIIETSNDVLPTLVQGRLANAYVVELLVTVGGVKVTDFGDGLVNVVLPYKKENMGQNTSVYHISDSGAMTRFAYAVYDDDARNVTFNTRHFSYYAVVEELSKFTDVYSTDFFYDAILWTVQNDISYGTTSLTFSPQLICTRGEAMTMIWKAMGSNVADIVVPFKDIAPTDYYYEAVRWAYATAVTGGVRQYEFGPLEECTRAQIITFLWTAAGKPIAETTLNFNDVPAGCWYEDAVKWAVSEGITTGTYANQFGPEEPCTRGQIVTFLYQALGTAGV